MMDEHKQIRELGLAADRLRTEPAFAEAVTNLRKDAVAALIAADPTNPDEIRRQQAKIQAIDGLCTEITTMIHRAAALARPGRQAP
jgi:hypothetical protein